MNSPRELWQEAYEAVRARLCSVARSVSLDRLLGADSANQSPIVLPVLLGLRVPRFLALSVVGSRAPRRFVFAARRSAQIHEWVRPRFPRSANVRISARVYQGKRPSRYVGVR
jgi:hypothetical protein